MCDIATITKMTRTRLSFFGPNLASGMVLVMLLLISLISCSQSHPIELVDLKTVHKVVGRAVYSYSQLGEKPFPRWKDAKIDFIHTMYDLEGLPTAYYVVLISNQDEVGYLIISARKNFFPIFQCGGSPMHIDLLKKRIREVFLKNNPNASISEIKLLYFGGLCPYLEITTKTKTQQYFSICDWNKLSYDNMKKIHINFMECSKAKREKKEQIKIKNAWESLTNPKQ